MNPEAEQKLNEIVAKDVNELTDYDMGFLRARRTYLSSADKEKFADVLKVKRGRQAKDQEEEETVEDSTTVTEGPNGAERPE